jgi:predicted nucleic acid-binding protein
MPSPTLTSPTSQRVTRLLGERLELVEDLWETVLHSECPAGQAERLLRLHPLRAADSLQLAAALVACHHEPATLALHTADTRLADAARREGFPVPG